MKVHGADYSVQRGGVHSSPTAKRRRQLSTAHPSERNPLAFLFGPTTGSLLVALSALASADEEKLYEVPTSIDGAFFAS